MKSTRPLGEQTLARLTFLGAAGGVTGSQFLLETHRSRVLVECGMLQGSREARRLNAAPFAHTPDDLDAVVLTHAHIDHSGLLPKLVRDGYRGPIHATRGTRDLCKIMLADAAYIQESDAERRNRHRKRGEPAVEPLYVREDADRVMELMLGHGLDEEVEVSTDVTIRFRHASHILGAASVELWIRDQVARRKLVFSGDIGRRHDLLLEAPDTVNEADLVVMETTYGDRDHRSWDDTLTEFEGILASAHAARQNVVIPTFAVGRAQELLHCFHDFLRDGRMAPRTIFLDSPMAIDVTDLYRRNLSRLQDDIERGGDLLRPVGLVYSQTRDDSMAINEQRGVIILSASGMCEAGRIQFHLEHNLPHAGAHIVIVGFQARGTLGRKLVDGADRVKIMGREIPVRASVHTVGGFSAHGGRSGLLAWLGAFAREPGKPALALVHGEPESRSAFAATVKQRYGLTAMEPERGDWIDIPRSGTRMPLTSAAGAARRSSR